ncbi:DUF1833 family protein [Thiothrix nivea]|uniref:DUF1833 domain-containing protein n=1 Tax=Thiothrix nivea (strain ATCC 35100 / DSM 5205 / JP2) TaxID=870187 RepID=A0A656HAQ7_THINJ|nr:DUF1833 family protein [Thiothrix nivea]EIJ33313.1 protein of unknown function DUF1833 [Thiothrix nivea DSM 5205]
MAAYDAVWKEAVLMAPTDKTFIDTLEISSPLLAQPIRVCNSFTNLVTGHGDFQPFYFELELPQVEPNTVPQLLVKIANVSATLREGLRQIKAATGATSVRYRRYQIADATGLPVLDEEMGIPLPVARVGIPMGSAFIAITCEPVNIVNIPLHKNLYTTARFPGLKT